MKILIPQVLLLLLFAALTIYTQDKSNPNETRLRDVFEGTKVLVKIDMPGDRSGVDVEPEKAVTVNVKTISARKKAFGISLHEKDIAEVTKIKIAGRRIEFHLDGGGYDPALDPPPYVQPRPKRECPEETKWKKILAAAIKDNDVEQIRYARKKRDDAAKLCAQEYNDKIQDYREAVQNRDIWLRDKRPTMGSRFNIWFKKIPETVTPDDVKRWLADYVDFSLVAVKGVSVEKCGNETGEKPSNIAVSAYWGEWRNIKGETLHVEDGCMRVRSGSARKYKELCRFAGENLFAVEIENDQSTARFILIKITNSKITLAFYDTLKNLQDGMNKQREEIWTRQ